MVSMNYSTIDHALDLAQEKEKHLDRLFVSEYGSWWWNKARDDYEAACLEYDQTYSALQQELREQLGG
jgi:hypothetical protein